VNATDVTITRASLRGMRSLVAGVTLGMAALAGGVALMAIDQQERCEAGNQLRREDLPAAFHEFGEFLGGELGGDPADVEDANRRFARRLDEAFPERDCSLFP